MNLETTRPAAENAHAEKEMLQQYLRGLDSIRRSVREETLRQVRALPPKQLLQLVQVGASQYRKLYRVSSYIELPLLAVSVPTCLFLSVEKGIGVQAMCWSLLVLATAIIVGHTLFVPWRMYRSLINVLANTNDIRMVGPMVSMFAATDGSMTTRVILAKTLCRLLPQLRSNHANLLTSEQKRDLITLLGAGLQTEQRDAILLMKKLKMRALKALEQVGDESAIPALKNMIAAMYPKNSEVRIAAKHCLEFLKLNADTRRETQTLLRASDATSAVKTDTLLRSASAANTSIPPEELLRPQI